jgi:NTP pyrophosphatase (non-canonical NTP hydrolase)
MSQTNFQNVVDFNTQFGVLEGELKPKLDIIKSDPAQVEFCLKLIREEMRELEDAVKTNDYVEMIDALADILYVVYGMGARVGMDMDKAFALVHANNMSKLCATEEEAQKSVGYYNTLDANATKNTVQGQIAQSCKDKLPQESVLHPMFNAAYRRAPNGVDWVVFNQATKKILKRYNYVPVDLSPLIQ